MSIFQTSILKSTTQDESKIAQRWAKYQNFLAKVEFVKSVKEEKYQDGFLHDIFEECLGYTLDNTNPQNFNLEREKKNETDGKKADGVIHLNGEVVGIIELKDQKSKNLDAVEAQAFNYHASHSNSKYIIISNFDELRFYIDKKTAYEKFNLFYLTYEEFKKLHLLLSYESIKEGLPLKLKEKSANFELQISKELYRDFSIFRNHLFENIVKNNFVIAEALAVVTASETPTVVIASETPTVVIASEARQSLNKSTFLRLTQKLCDRIIFILFAEDRGLLRHNTIKEIREEFKGQKFTSYALYDIYKFYFNAINEGNEKLGIPKYNGGLFAKDELLDSLIIDDEVLNMEAQKLSDYDFMSDVGVNILGHIFEQSLTDLEEIQANIDNADFDKKQGKRKKDGVFYTPEYITRYIVENTLGRLCEEKKKELNILEALPAIETSFVIARSEATKQSSTKKRLPRTEVLAMTQYKQNILDYREWLTNLKILDPACGSGAFLNQALEFLIKEHTLVRDMLLPFEDLTLGYEIEKEILEHNLYGVDINEDAVEIAKLSLWLRTAHKGRELTSLAEKIVCANSLLEMPFEEGSFDVVIGNPPYVRQEMIDNETKTKYMQMYPQVATSTADLYVYFYELSMKCLSENGLLGFITPNKWMERKYGINLRSYLKNFNIQTIINYGELNIFDDASTEPAIIIIKNYKSFDDIAYLMVKSLEEAQSFYYKTSIYKKSDLSDEIWKFTNPLVSSILNKFRNVNTTLQEYTNGGNFRGILTGLNEAFIIDKTKYLEIVTQDKASEKLLKKMVEGDDFGKWHLNHSGRYMVATGYDLEIENEYKGIYNYLEQYRDKLIKRQDKGKNYWNLRACDYYDKLEQPKLIYYHTALNHGFYYDTEGYYISANCYFIANADKYLQCLLNSKLFHFIKKYLFPSFGDSEQGGRVRLDANKMNILPIQKIEENQKEFYIQKADKMLSLNKQLQETKQNFTNELGLEKLTKKLQNFEELEFEEFVSEYAKAKKLKFADKLAERNFKQEWQAIFENDKILTCRLKNEIAKTDKEIDEMVYKLYDLNDEEIGIVENKI